jgi:hypothetical protein
MTIGVRIHAMPARVDWALVDRFRAIPVANISGSMSRTSARSMSRMGARSMSRMGADGPRLQMAAIKGGTSDRAGIDATLTRLGCKVMG